MHRAAARCIEKTLFRKLGFYIKRTFDALLFQLAGNLVGNRDIMIEVVIVSRTAAAAEIFCPTFLAIGRSEDVVRRETFLT